MIDPFWSGVLWGVGATYGVSFILAVAFGLYLRRASNSCTSHAKKQRRPVMADESTEDWWSRNLEDATPCCLRRRADDSIRSTWLSLRELYNDTEMLTDEDCEAWEVLCRHPAIEDALRGQKR
jgi:hypothetical protein